MTEYDGYERYAERAKRMREANNRAAQHRADTMKRNNAKQAKQDAARKAIEDLKEEALF